MTSRSLGFKELDLESAHCNHFVSAVPNQIMCLEHKIVPILITEFRSILSKARIPSQLLALMHFEGMFMLMPMYFELVTVRYGCKLYSVPGI